MKVNDDITYNKLIVKSAYLFIMHITINVGWKHLKIG